ncbi:hypothetical protein [Microbulbifer halophilus]|uniref:EF-hand domain-containing protein n=1 Tax=Microbulbifer halophilus TaxID=453963 RepID=A0ABW5EFL3_9GAMM|nr:hypothetical protein [Microbulbifer halophilus]MCW8128001.1 hypothetical protein [Microbulbifer halophilus]
MNGAALSNGLRTLVLVIAVALAAVWLFDDGEELPMPAVSGPDLAPPSASDTQAGKTLSVAPAGGPAPAAALRPDGELSAGQPQPIVGQSLQLREMRGEGGALRNLEFVFRRGVLPRQLFNDGRQLIASYRPLHRNSVGYGASTIFFLYQLVREDRNGDGRLTPADGIDLGISRPDGSDFRILDRALEQVEGIEHFPARGRLQVAVRVDGARESREYALSDG